MADSPTDSYDGEPSYRLVVDSDGKRTLVDAGGIRWFTEEAPDVWVCAADAASWPSWRMLSRLVLATEVPS